MLVLGVFAILIFLYSLVSDRLEKTIVTAPMIFTLGGIIFVLAEPGPVQQAVNTNPVLQLAEITLAVVLFTDATRISYRNLIGSMHLPTRLLVVGMPLTILSGAIVAVMLTDLTIWEAAILATVLAPTDAGLGHAIVSSPRVTVRIRQALNVEAGLNDGLAVPFLMLFIALAAAAESVQPQSWIAYTAQQIGFGLLLGIGFGWLGGWLVGWAKQRHWMDPTFQQLALLALAVGAWLTADRTGGNGFIAAFVAGLAIQAGLEDAGETMIDFSHAWGQLLNLFMFFVFGMLTTPKLGNFNGFVVLYAVLSLTAIRMLPVVVALIGTRLQPATVLFLGWFGPRGLASIVLGLIYLKQEVSLPGEPTVLLVVMATVLLSVFAHGITAAPGIELYARQIEGMAADAPELRDVVVMPIR